MGVDSRAYIPSVSKQQIRKFMSHVAKDVKLETTHDEDYHVLNFSYKGEKRSLHLFNRIYDRNKYIKYAIDKYGISKNEAIELADEELERNKIWEGTSGVMANFGFWGRSIEILQLLCYRFGGYLDESDSDDKDFYEIKKNYRKIVPIIFKE